MTISIPYYCKSLDWDKFMADYPPPPHFHTTVGRLSADAMHALQERRFLDRVAEAWDVPFYRRRWTAAGLDKGDVTQLEHIERIPIFNSDDLKEALQSAPPFGDHYRFDRSAFGTMPLKIQTSGGTTGMPRPTLFDPVAWEVQGIQMARAAFEQGALPGDVVQVTYTNSLANAGWNAFNALFNWMGCVPVTTGSGVVTPSMRKLEYAREWGVDWWFARGEYLGRLAQVAEENGFDLHQLKTRFLFSFLGPDVDGYFRAKLEAAWGCPVYDNYGTHEIGLIAFEGRERKGKHINEDTCYVEIVDTDTGVPLPYGQRGNLVATSLHRSVPPIIRYDLRDLMIMTDREESESGIVSRKLSTFLGRADEMVKLRGTNVYPLACQSAVTKDDRTTGDYICVVRYVGEGISRREEMTVRIERKSADVDSAALEAAMRQALYKDLGVKVDVEIVEPGALAEFTRLGKDKVRRLLDLRKS